MFPLKVFYRCGLLVAILVNGGPLRFRKDKRKMEGFTLLDLLLDVLSKIPPEKLKEYQFETEEE